MPRTTSWANCCASDGWWKRPRTAMESLLLCKKTIKTRVELVRNLNYRSSFRFDDVSLFCNFDVDKIPQLLDAKRLKNFHVEFSFSLGGSEFVTRTTEDPVWAPGMKPNRWQNPTRSTAHWKSRWVPTVPKDTHLCNHWFEKFEHLDF